MLYYIILYIYVYIYICIYMYIYIYVYYISNHLRVAGHGRRSCCGACEARGACGACGCASCSGASCGARSQCCVRGRLAHETYETGGLFQIWLAVRCIHNMMIWFVHCQWLKTTWWFIFIYDTMKICVVALAYDTYDTLSTRCKYMTSYLMVLAWWKKHRQHRGGMRRIKHHRFPVWRCVEKRTYVAQDAFISGFHLDPFFGESSLARMGWHSFFFAETSNFGRNTSNFGWLIPVIYKGFTVTEVAKHWVAGGSAFKLHSKGIGERQKKGRESVWSLLFLSFPGDMFQLTFFL